MKKQGIKNSEIFDSMEAWAPGSLAYDWDNVGLQTGSYHNQVKKVMITLDVLESVVDEAIDQDIDLIIAHHPLLFKSLKKLDTDDTKGRILQKLIQHDITVYAAHTNLDAADGGVNDMLCDALGITDRCILLPDYMEKLVKITVYVPKTHADEVRNAISESGAGYIGDYSHCTFQTSGQGTFMPLEGTNPYIGEAYELEFVDEMKIESIVPQPKLAFVLNAITKSHPYEEPAYDIYPMENKGKTLGVGRIGKLEKDMSLQSFGEHVKKMLDIKNLRITGALSGKIRTAAILGGSGETYWKKALEMGADVYITGDMTFHAAQDAWQAGLSIIDPGHYAEKVMKQTTKEFLERNFQDTELEITVSEVHTDPFQFI